MDTLLRIGLENAVATVPLAIVAFLAGLICRRPAVRHGLWLLVLLKFVAPPLVAVPVSWVSAEAKSAAPLPPSEPAAEPPRFEPLEDIGVDETTPAPTIARPALFSWRGALQTVVVLWLGGAILGLGLTVVRVASFRRLLRHAALADTEISRRARQLARAIGLKDAPGVWLVPGSVCPMLWALLGPPRLLLPRELWDRMEADERDSLLLHELAHLKRRDHRVRWLEMAVSLLFWWHPVAWWARRNLREAEEQCCDAWVLWALPKANRAYANALLHAVEFLSGSPNRLPVAASGMGEAQHLRRRLLMIKQGGTPRSLSLGGSLLLWAAAALFLPLAPSWGQVEREPKKADAPAPTAPTGDTVSRITLDEVSRIALDDVSADVVLQKITSDDPAADDSDVRDDLKSARQAVARLQAELSRAQARLSALEGRLRGATTARIAPDTPRATRGRGGRAAEPTAPPSPDHPPLPPRISDDAEPPATPAQPRAPRPPTAPRAPRAPRAPGAPPAMEPPDAPPAPPLVTPPAARGPGGPPPMGADLRPGAPPRPARARATERQPRTTTAPAEPGAAADQRLRDVEQKLDRLIEELREIRKDRAPTPGAAKP